MPRAELAPLFSRRARHCCRGHHGSAPEFEIRLDYDSIKRGVQEASRIRVREIQEDYPWVDDVLGPLAGRVVPCRFEEIEERWEGKDVIPRLRQRVESGGSKLPPRNIAEGSHGVRRDLEDLDIFLRMHDGRVNIPDVFRVGYGIGRRGGVKPAR